MSSNLLENKCTAGNLFYSCSDHFPNFLIVEDFYTTNRNYKRDKIKKRFLSKINHEALCVDMNNIYWNETVQ